MSQVAERLSAWFKHFVPYTKSWENQECIISLAREVSHTWEHAFRRPANAKEIMDALRTRRIPPRILLRYEPIPHYRIHQLETRLEECARIPLRVDEDIESSFFAAAERTVWRLFLSLVAFKLSFLGKPSRATQAEDLVLVRQHFFPTDNWYERAVRVRSESLVDSSLLHNSFEILLAEEVGGEDACRFVAGFTADQIVPKAKVLLTPLPEEWRAPLFQVLSEVDVKLTEEPGALLRCTTDPRTRRIEVHVAKDRKFSRPFLRLAAAHEMGHAISSALFDIVWHRQKMVGPMWSFAGISSPNPFDPKEEAFADLFAKAILDKKEDLLLLNHRLRLWLPTRAVADYAYHEERKSAMEVMTLFEEVGLKTVATEETFAVMNQFSSLQAQYFFGHQHAVDLQRRFQLTDQELLILLLLAGNAPFFFIEQFLREAEKKAPVS